MNIQKIKTLLDSSDQEHVDKYVAYLNDLANEKRNGATKNYWLNNMSDEKLANYFKGVEKDGLFFDGDTITLISTGVSYNYQAYKNKMLLAYPESKIDVALVYKDDEFSFEKKSGQVGYTHKLKNPFAQKDEDIIGAYCVIKNKRGEFLTTMSPEEIEKHRKVAKTDFIWKQWFKEMCLKTVIKKACSKHFKDTYQNIEEIDNENYDLENPLEIEIDHKSNIDQINTLNGLKKYHEKHQGSGAEVVKYLTIRKKQIIDNQKSNDNSQRANSGNTGVVRNQEGKDDSVSRTGNRQ